MWHIVVRINVCVGWRDNTILECLCAFLDLCSAKDLLQQWSPYSQVDSVQDGYFIFLSG